MYICPQCKWSGQYKDTVGVALAGVVSPYCPVCWTKVVPMEASTQCIGGHMFEYLRLDMNDGSHPIRWEQLGRDGWELVTIHKDVAYFKRAIEPVIYVDSELMNLLAPLPGK